MKSLSPYLIFHGCCQEAMTFYADVFGGKLVEISTFAESPVPVPEEFGDRIFNSEIRIGEISIKASDDLPGHDVVVGSNVSLFVELQERSEQLRLMESLGDGGKVLFPADDKFGMVEDKYGIRWMLVHSG